MKRRATNSAGTVSLFPFLAVLVCAMGALILLLLVTTRRIRQRTLADETIVQPAAGKEPVVLPLPRTSPSAPSPGPPPPLAAVPDAEVSDQPILPLLAGDPPPSSTPQRPDGDDAVAALRSRLADLDAEQAALADAVSRSRTALLELETEAANETRLLTTLDEQAVSLLSEKQRLNNLYVRLREQYQAAAERADQLRTKIRQARDQLADADSRFAIIPYDGRSGTTRRPVIIECTRDSFTFVSEGVTLRADDLDGFVPSYNPLLYATQGLIRYWDRRDRQSAAEDVGEPYLLLVVRPEAATSYYVARGLLEGLHQPFGYELVTADQQFTWPPGDPEASTICRTLIEKMLAERNQLMAVALHRGAHLSRFSDDAGHFRLEEIDRLRDPTPQVTINGQHYSRDAGGFGGTPGSRQSLRANGSGTAAPAVPSSGSRSDTGLGPRSSTSGKPLKFDGAPESTGPRGMDRNQQSVATQEDHRPEWLREGTPRLTPPQTTGAAPDWSSARRSGAETDLATQKPPPHWPAEAGLSGTNSATDAGLRSGVATPAQSRDATASTSPSSPPHPEPEMLTVTPDRKRSEPTVDPIRPQWGLRTSSGTIGFEREVQIRVESSQITVGDASALQIAPSLSSGDLRRLLAASINREVRGWGPPPRSFYWVPSVRFIISPGGAVHYQRLRSIVQGWELRSTHEHAAE